MPRLLVAAIAALGLAAGACAGPPPQVTALDAQRGHVELATLQEGRSLLVKRCSGCHAAPRPAEHVAADWPRKLGEMADRAHLAAAERGLIEEYLVVMATPAYTARR